MSPNTPAPKPALPASQPNPVVAETIAIIGQLADLLEAESEHLRSRRYQEALRLSGEKSRLAMIYEQRQNAMTSRPGFLAGLREDDQKALREAVGRLRSVARDNYNVLHAVRDVAQRVYQFMVEAVRESSQVNFHYNRSGGYGTGIVARASGYVQQPLSVRLNQTF
jgi:flagellar biosynthesis/type III secretory pathway chaperone